MLVLVLVGQVCHGMAWMSLPLPWPLQSQRWQARAAAMAGYGRTSSWLPGSARALNGWHPADGLDPLPLSCCSFHAVRRDECGSGISNSKQDRR